MPRSNSSASRNKATSTAEASPNVEMDAKRAASRKCAEEDREIVQRFLAGDPKAFDEIVARYREKLFAVALSLLRNHGDAEEIVQDAFVRAFRGLKNFRGDSSLATWLHRITVNLARNRYWYFHRRSRHATLSLDCPVADASNVTFGDFLASSSPGHSREIAVGEFTELVSVCMDKLHPAHRDILTMRNVLNQSYDEIAAVLGIEVGTVKSRIARARGCLRSLMAETCPDFGEDAAPTAWLELTEERTKSSLLRAG